MIEVSLTSGQQPGSSGLAGRRPLTLAEEHVLRLRSAATRPADPEAAARTSPA